MCARVQTYGLRGTVHLFPAGELPLWTAALRANQPPAVAGAAARIGEILEAPVALTFGPVERRPHL